MRNRFKVLSTDYHRNGMSGAGFHVALVKDNDEKRTFLVVDFTSSDPEGFREYGYTAVLDPAEAAAGNIFMHSRKGHEGGNAWRGDVLGDKYRAAIHEAQDAHWRSIGVMV